MTTFGPQLIGETEKTLNAILRHSLAGTRLTEPQWVTLRLAEQNDDATPLGALARDRAHFAEADAIVAALEDRGLVADDRLSPTGRELVATALSRTAAATASVFGDLPSDDAAAAERTLTTILTRARAYLSTQVGE